MPEANAWAAEELAKVFKALKFHSDNRFWTCTFTFNDSTYQHHVLFISESKWWKQSNSERNEGLLLTVQPDLPIITTFHMDGWPLKLMDYIQWPNHKFHTTFRFTSDMYMYHWRIQSFSHSWTLELYAKRVYKMEKQINKHAFFFLHTAVRWF